MKEKSIKKNRNNFLEPSADLDPKPRHLSHVTKTKSKKKNPYKKQIIKLPPKIGTRCG